MSRVVRRTALRRNARAILDWVRTNREEVIIQTYGSPQAVIISCEEYQNYKRLQARVEQRQEVVRRLSRIAEEVSQRTSGFADAEVGALVGEAVTAARRS